METTKLIEDYLDNVLSEEDRLSVEKRAASDKSFSNLIRLHKEVNESIRDTQLMSLNKILTKLGNEFNASTKKSVTSIRLLRIAAAILIIAGSAVIIKLGVFNRSPEDRIFNTYYETYHVDAISRSAGNQLSIALEKFASGEYEKAFTLFDAITIAEKDNYNAWFYRGLASMEMNDFPEAIRSFNSIPSSWDHIYGEHRNWYLGLSLLKQGNLSDARELFTKITKQKGHYAVKAEEILVKLPS